MLSTISVHYKVGQQLCSFFFIILFQFLIRCRVFVFTTSLIFILNANFMGEHQAKKNFMMYSGCARDLQLQFYAFALIYLDNWLFKRVGTVGTGTG